VDHDFIILRLLKWIEINETVYIESITEETIRVAEPGGIPLNLLIWIGIQIAVVSIFIFAIMTEIEKLRERKD
jgi:hypothetical protein